MKKKRQPRLSRPQTAASYGLKPEHEGELLSWEATAAKLAAARNYWCCTVGGDGRPHTTPIWGIWWDDAFYFGTDPRSRKGKNLTWLPQMTLNLESGDDVVILEGEVVLETDAALLSSLWEMYGQKYALPVPDKPVPLYRLQPQKGFAWLEESYPETATRYLFD